MSMSISSAADASSTIQSLLQSLGNVAGNAAGIGPVGDWLAAAGKGAGTSANTGAGQPPAQSFGVSPPPFQNGTMAALIALKSQDGQAAADPNGAAGVQELPANPDGSVDSVDPSELLTAARRGHGRHRHHGVAQQNGIQAPPLSLIDQLAKTQAQLSLPPAATVSTVA
jgi:hypothetical protein